MSISATVKAHLVLHKIKYELISHPRTYSSKDSAQMAHVPDDHIAKAVIVRDENGYAMAVIPGRDWLKMQALQEESGRVFKLANEAEVDDLFPDCQPGAIPPVGPAYGIETYLDESLTSLANVYFEAGDHENLVHVGGEDFQALFSSVRHGHFSHDD